MLLDLLAARWRRPARERRIFPVAEILKRFAADFFVLLRANGLGIGLSVETRAISKFERLFKKNQRVFAESSGCASGA